MSIDNDRIEQLKRKLYSRTEATDVHPRSVVEGHDTPVENSWGNDVSLHIPDVGNQHSVHPILKKVFAVALLFFVIACGAVLYILFGKGTGISSENVDISVVGPSSTSSGEEINLGLSIKNNNSTDLESVTFTTTYPEGAREKQDSNTPLTRTIDSIQVIKKGEILNKTLKFVLFGDKGLTKTVSFKMEYKIKGSNATFVKEKLYDIAIGSSPVIVSVSGPTEINNAQDLEFTVSVTSNSTAVLSNVLVQAEYPYGYTYADSSLKPSSGNNIWNIGDLKNGDKKTFTIRGQLVAQNNEERTFRFLVGTNNDGDTKGPVDVVLGTMMPTLVVKKSFVDVGMAINGSTNDVVPVSAGTGVSANITTQNTLSDRLSNVSITATLSGDVFDKQSVGAQQGGFYQSAQNQVIWTSANTSGLLALDPGESQSVGFSFNSLSLPPRTKNPELTLKTVVSGSRSTDSGGTEQVNATITRKVRLSSTPQLTAQALRVGTFSGSGPFPPKSEVSSTYTVHLAISNTYNDLSNVSVTTVLPQNVEWTNRFSPSAENISYDSNSRKVTWNPNTVSAGSGYTISARQVDFEVRIVPSASQIGSEARLTNDFLLTGDDVFSTAKVKATAVGLTTRAYDTAGSGVVTP